MGLSLTLYNFAKRHNSTALPSSGGSVVGVVLKRETSLNAPTFLLQGAYMGSGDFPNYNYAKFNDAYYFIDDIVSVRDNVYEIRCTLDVLASLKPDILATTAFVEYCTGGSDDIQDDRIVPGASNSIYSATGGYLGFLADGCYLLSAVGESGVDTFILQTQNALSNLFSQISNWADNLVVGGMSIEDTLAAVGKQLMSAGNAMSCVRDCRWIPVNPLDMAYETTGRVSLGMYTAQVMAGRVTRKITTKSIDITIPFSRSGFLRLQPYSEVVLYLPFVGNVVITSPRLASSSNLHIDFSRNDQSGEVAYKVSVGGEVVGTYGGSTAICIPVGVSNVTPQSLITSGAAAIVGATYNPIGAVASAASLQPTTSAIGGIQGGAGAGLSLVPEVYVVERSISGAVGNMASIQGKPLFATRTLSNLSGYVKTRGASVGGAHRDTLREMANNLLDNGVFLE